MLSQLAAHLGPALSSLKVPAFMVDAPLSRMIKDDDFILVLKARVNLQKAEASA